MAERKTDTQAEFHFTRELAAPRELVFRVWTDPKHLAEWWGPKGFKMITCKVDLRPGGMFHYGMEAPNGAVMWGRFVYREVVAPERLVFVVSFSDEKAGVTRHPMSATWPLEVLNHVTFSENGGKTTVTLQGYPINSTEEEMETFAKATKSMEQGFGGTFAQLAEYLEKVAK